MATLVTPEVMTAEPETSKTADKVSAFSWKKFNLMLALVYAVEAVGVVIFGGSRGVPVTVRYPADDQLATQATGHQVLGSAFRHVFDLRLTVIAAIFLLAFALVQVLLATGLRKRYEAFLARGLHVGRWLSFGVGGGLVIAALALVGAVNDAASLLMVFAFTMFAGVLIAVDERLAAENRKGMPANLMCGAAFIAGLVPWIVLGRGVVAALIWDGTVPNMLWVLYATSLVLFGCFALAAYFSLHRKGKWADVVYTEKMYAYLGLATATVVAWQLFARSL
jgi:heliorhodopsin